MHNKKILFIVLFLLLFFTGCTPEYSIVIKDDKILETLKISSVSDDYTERSFPSRYSIPEQKKLYNKDFKNRTLTYSYEYNFLELYKSNMLKTCFNAFNLVKEDELYIFQTGDEFLCYPYQEGDFQVYKYNQLAFKIKTNHQVVENNADEISNDTYIWYINKDNYNNKEITFKFKKINAEKKNDTVKNNIRFNPLVIVIIFSSIIVLGVIIGMYILNLNKKNNKL